MVVGFERERVAVGGRGAVKSAEARTPAAAAAHACNKKPGKRCRSLSLSLSLSRARALTWARQHPWCQWTPLSSASVLRVCWVRWFFFVDVHAEEEAQHAKRAYTHNTHTHTHTHTHTSTHTHKAKHAHRRLLSWLASAARRTLSSESAARRALSSEPSCR